MLSSAANAPGRVVEGEAGEDVGYARFRAGQAVAAALWWALPGDSAAWALQQEYLVGVSDSAALRDIQKRAERLRLTLFERPLKPARQERWMP